ncbi:hypothetical protein C0J52_25778 [Blattella germanica]|nr:hypothetical protein C0J52_25778 [Blattella germanica]
MGPIYCSFNRMSKEQIQKEVMTGQIFGRRSVGTPVKRWLDAVKNYRNWKIKAEDIEDWKLIIQNAQTGIGMQRHYGPVAPFEIDIHSTQAQTEVMQGAYQRSTASFEKATHKTSFPYISAFLTVSTFAYLLTLQIGPIP